jgi:thiosulfate dehydrogenase (quinone) large subunit
MASRKERIVWFVLRVMMGWIFLWPFLDKLFGWGFATEVGKGWINGVSPTFGFLNFGTKGVFSPIFKAIAGNVLVDWLFMIGLLLIGLSLIFGMAMRLATWSGVSILALMYIAGFMPPEHNPFLDEHLIYAMVLIVLNLFGAGKMYGLQKR